jgi:hypothetical protein
MLNIRNLAFHLQTSTYGEITLNYKKELTTQLKHSHPICLALRLLNSSKCTITSDTSTNLFSVCTGMTGVYIGCITKILLLHQITKDFVALLFFFEVNL